MRARVADEPPDLATLGTGLGDYHAQPKALLHVLFRLAWRLDERSGEDRQASGRTVTCNRADYSGKSQRLSLLRISVPTRANRVWRQAEPWPRVGRSGPLHLS